MHHLILGAGPAGVIAAETLRKHAPGDRITLVGDEVPEVLLVLGVAQALEVVRSGAVNRLYSGPFETRAMAQEAMRALPSSLGLKPIVVRR